MWEHQNTVKTRAEATAVWCLYADVTTWPRWNPAVKYVELDGPFTAGAAGTLTPNGQGPLAFRIVECRSNEGYSSETEIASTVTLRLDTRLVPLPEGGTRITHHASLTGPAADFFGQSFGPTRAAGLPVAMGNLAEQAQVLQDGSRRSWTIPRWRPSWRARVRPVRSIRRPTASSSSPAATAQPGTSPAIPVSPAWRAACTNEAAWLRRCATGPRFWSA